MLTPEQTATCIVLNLRGNGDLVEFNARLPYRPDWQYEIAEITRVLDLIARTGQRPVVVPAESEEAK